MYHIIFIRVLQIAIHLYFFPGENISTGKILLLWFFIYNSNENGLWNKQIDQLPQSRLIILKFAISSTSFPSPFIANDLATPFNFGEPVQPTSSVLTALVAGLKKKREREREREMETEEKRGSKRYTRRIYTWPAPSRARTRNNVHYASLTRFLPLLAFFRGRKERWRGTKRAEQHPFPIVGQPPPSFGRRVVFFFQEEEEGKRKKSPIFRGVGQSDLWLLNPFPSVTGMLLPRLDCLAGRDRKFTARAKNELSNLKSFEERSPPLKSSIS